ncbi:MAG: phosphatidylglycerophosphatase A [Desulfatitalea sp.]|nr:phosphatidylglycerophosphatase A [Desulfatitalea sp.]
MYIRRATIMFLATGCYVGRFPTAPGTMGALLGLPVAFILAGLPLPAALFWIVLLTMAAVWIAGKAERQLGRKDPGCIVIDEIAGMAVAVAGIPLTLETGVAGFLLFRLFDIFKPFPIGYAERRLPGGWGIVMDDIIAGLMANVVLRMGLFLVRTIG